MASSFKNNTTNLTSSDYTTGVRYTTNYNYVKKNLHDSNFKNKNCFVSHKGFIKVKSINLNKSKKKLSNVRNFELLHDLKKRFYSTKC